MQRQDAERGTILLDITHPAHLLRYVPLAQRFAADGLKPFCIGREKEAIERLLTSAGVQHESPRGFSTWRIPNTAALVLELLHRVAYLATRIRRSDVRLVLTSNPAGCIAAWLVRTPVIFDTVDGCAAGIHHRLAAPFATIITSPSSLAEYLGDRHLRYRSYKALAWLHPERFVPQNLPSEGVVDPDRPLVVLRAVAHRASHDRGISGFTEEQLLDLVARIEASGAQPIISMEADTQRLATSEILRRRPDLLSSILASSSLVISDGASVVEEAAVLGVPAIRLSTPRGERDYLWDLERRYGLVTNIRVGDEERFDAVVDDHLARLGTLRSDAEPARRRLLEEHHDGVQWYVDLVKAVLASESKGGKALVEELRRAGFDESPLE